MRPFGFLREVPCISSFMLLCSSAVCADGCVAICKPMCCLVCQIRCLLDDGAANEYGFCHAGQFLLVYFIIESSFGVHLFFLSSVSDVSQVHRLVVLGHSDASEGWKVCAIHRS